MKHLNYLITLFILILQYSLYYNNENFINGVDSNQSRIDSVQQSYNSNKINISDTNYKNTITKNIKNRNFFSKINKFSTIIIAIVGLIALYLGDLQKRIFKPRLKLEFKGGMKYPFYQKISFESYGLVRCIKGDFAIFRPGINIRVKVINKGSVTAKSVYARIEKIEIFHDSNLIVEKYYHPTMLHWSGELEWKPIDISPKSHFFLDLFFVKNEKKSEILKHNLDIIKETNLGINEETIKEIINYKINIIERIYWNVWIDPSYSRGLPTEYYQTGNIKIHVLLNSDNCKPLKFISIVNWDCKNWDKPAIQLIKYR